MRKFDEILRLLATARSCRVARSTVKEYQIRARAAGLERWEDVKDLAYVGQEAELPATP